MSAAWQHHGFTVVAVAEKIASKQLSLRRRFKKARVLQDATEVTRESVGLEAVSSVFGGIPCQPIARAGGARGIDDDRIADTTDALPAAALALGADSADAENHADLVSISNGAVLDRLNANFGAAFLLADVSYVNCAAANAPEERNRVALRWETTSMLASIGPCPPLSLIRWPRLRICDIMLPLHDVADDQWVAGRVVVRPPSPATPGKAQPVADLHISADDPIRRGSLVRRSGSLFTVAALDEAAGTAKLFRDVRRAEAYFDDVPVAELTHVAQSCTLLSTSSIASAFTRFGVGLTKNRKHAAFFALSLTKRLPRLPCFIQFFIRTLRWAIRGPSMCFHFSCHSGLGRCRLGKLWKEPHCIALQRRSQVFPGPKKSACVRSWLRTSRRNWASKKGSWDGT